MPRLSQQTNDTPAARKYPSAVASGANVCGRLFTTEGEAMSEDKASEADKRFYKHLMGQFDQLQKANRRRGRAGRFISHDIGRKLRSTA